jgi:hypothetical protein
VAEGVVPSAVLKVVMVSEPGPSFGTLANVEVKKNTVFGPKDVQINAVALGDFSSDRTKPEDVGSAF